MQGSGSFTQTGGTNTANSLHELGSFAGSRGTYELRGGSLAVWNQNIGYWGTGTFKQSGGDNAVSNNLVLGFSDSGTGTYELSGTSSLSARNQYIGGYGTFNNLTYVGGTGIFKQSGGTNTVSEYLFLGFNLGSRGEYVLSDGSLRSLTLTLGYPGGSGFFTQNGGTNISNGLGVLHGDYNLNGGSLSAPIQIFGYWGVEGYGLGRFIQSGGTNTATDYITLYGYYGGHGAYLLQGGVLNAGTINVWPNGFFNQTGGALTAATFNLQGGEVQGSLENRGTFNYNSGTFSGRLRNYGTVNFGSEFTLGNGLANYAALTLAAGRTLTLNGAGLDNQGTLTLDGGTLAGSGPLVNNATLSGYGAINAPGGLSNAGTMTLTGGSTTVQGDVANQASGQLSMVNSSALFTGNVTNSGTIKATKATVTFAGTYTEQGAYISNPSNTYAQTIVVTPSGYFQGGKGDSWFISNDFINRSAQNLLWDTALAGLTFSGPTGTVHEMYLPGANLGPNCFAHNFAWGSLDITGQNLRLLDGNTTPGGAQYVGEILGVILSGSLVTNITGNGLLDLYYNSSLPGNAYLGSRTFDLTGGGHLAPIPAPSTYLLLATGLAGLLAARGKRRR
jgi:hypothetical protein